MASISRKDKGQNPGTQSASTPEGAVGDGKMQAEVTVTLSGTPSQVAADYATLAAVSITGGATISWKKR